MQIKAELEHMGALAEKMKCIDNKMDIMKTHFVNITGNIDIEIKSKDNVDCMIKEAGEYLNQIRIKSRKYQEVIEYAQVQYRQAEERIKSLYLQIQGSKRENKTDKVLNRINKSREDISSPFLVQKQKIKPCPLPKKEQITKSNIVKGTILEGKNILIRTWRKHI